MINDEEVSFGEVTGPSQKKNDKAKNGWDLWGLARFSNCVLDEGSPMLSLILVVYNEASVYRHIVKLREFMILAEVGAFMVPRNLYEIGSFQISLPVLYWYKDAIKWLESNPVWRKRSWSSPVSRSETYYKVSPLR